MAALGVVWIACLPIYADANAALKATALYAEGCAALEQEKWDEAIRSFQAMIKHEPQNAEAYRMLGVAQFLQANTNQAIIAWKKAAELNAAGPSGTRARMAEARAGLQMMFGGLNPKDPLLAPSDYERYYRPQILRLPVMPDKSASDGVLQMLRKLDQSSKAMAFVRYELSAVREEWDRVSGTSDAVNIRLTQQKIEEIENTVREWARLVAYVEAFYRKVGQKDIADTLVKWARESPICRNGEAQWVLEELAKSLRP